MCVCTSNSGTDTRPRLVESTHFCQQSTHRPVCFHTQTHTYCTYIHKHTNPFASPSSDCAACCGEIRALSPWKPGQYKSTTVYVCIFVHMCICVSVYETKAYTDFILSAAKEGADTRGTVLYNHKYSWILYVLTVALNIFIFKGALVAVPM